MKILLALLVIISFAFGDAASCPACAEISSYPESGMFVTNNEEIYQAGALFYYENSSKNPTRQPIANAPLIVVIKNITNTKIRKVFTNDEGVATFNYANLNNSCQQIVFFYCPFKIGCGLDSCARAMGMNGTGDADHETIGTGGTYTDLASVPNAPGTSFDMPADFEMPKFLPSSPESVNYCPPKRSLLPAFCFPLAIIFALLAGALHLSGKNPLAGFDMSAPRPGRHIRYAARARNTFSMDVAGLASSIGSLAAGQAVSSGKGSKSLKEGNKGGTKPKSGAATTTSATTTGTSTAKIEASKPAAGRTSTLTEQRLGLGGGSTNIVSVAYRLFTGKLGEDIKNIKNENYARMSGADVALMVGRDIGMRSSLGGFALLYQGTAGRLVDRLAVQNAEKTVKAYEEGVKVVLKTDKEGNVISSGTVKIEKNGELTVIVDGKKAEKGSVEWNKVTDTHLDNLKDAFHTLQDPRYGAVAKMEDKKADFVQRAADAGLITKEDIKEKIDSLKKEEEKTKDPAKLEQIQNKIELLETAVGGHGTLASKEALEGKAQPQSVSEVVTARTEVLKEILAEKGANAEKQELQAKIDHLDSKKDADQIKDLKAQIAAVDPQKNPNILNREELVEKGVKTLSPELAKAYMEFAAAEQMAKTAQVGEAMIKQVQEKVGILDKQIETKKEEQAKLEAAMGEDPNLKRVGGLSDDNLTLAKAARESATDPSGKEDPEKAKDFLAKAWAARTGVQLGEGENVQDALKKMSTDVRGLEKDIARKEAEVVKIEKQIAVSGSAATGEGACRPSDDLKIKLEAARQEVDALKTKQEVTMASYVKLDDSRRTADQVSSDLFKTQEVKQQINEMYTVQKDLRSAAVTATTSAAVQYSNADQMQKTLEAAKYEEPGKGFGTSVPLIGTPIAKLTAEEKDLVLNKETIQYLQGTKAQLEKANGIMEYMDATMFSTTGWKGGQDGKLVKDANIDHDDMLKIGAAASLLKGQDYYAVGKDNLKNIDDRQLVLVKPEGKDAPVVAADYGSVKSMAEKGLYEAVYLDKDAAESIDPKIIAKKADGSFNPFVLPSITGGDDMIQINRATGQYFSNLANASSRDGAGASQYLDKETAEQMRVKPDQDINPNSFRNQLIKTASNPDGLDPDNQKDRKMLNDYVPDYEKRIKDYNERYEAFKKDYLENRDPQALNPYSGKYDEKKVKKAEELDDRARELDQDARLLQQQIDNVHKEREDAKDQRSWYEKVPIVGTPITKIKGKKGDDDSGAGGKGKKS